MSDVEKMNADIDAFMQKLLQAEKDTVATSWVVVCEASDADNSKPVWVFSNPGSSIITTMGLLEFGQEIQRVAIRNED